MVFRSLPLDAAAELERQQAPVVIVAHQAVLRCLYAYFLVSPSPPLSVSLGPFLHPPTHLPVALRACP